MRISPYAYPGTVSGTYSVISEMHIVRVICEHYRIRPEILAQRNRTRNIVQARQIAWYIMKKLVVGVTLKNMGWLFRMDHTTVIHGLRAIERDMLHNEEIKRLVEHLTREVKRSV